MVLGLGSCTTDDLDPTLGQQKPTEGSITQVNELQGLLFGALDRMTSVEYYGRDFIINGELRSDNVFANGNSGRFLSVAQMTYLPAQSEGVWDIAYKVISSCNFILTTDLESLEGDQDYGKHIQGQALMLRAFAHYDLIRNYGQTYSQGDLGVPYVKDFFYENIVEEMYPVRGTIEENKADLYADLEQAYILMQDAYEDSSLEQPNKVAAKALESKIATYFGDWDRVIEASEDVIESSKFHVIPATDYISSFAEDAADNSIFELAFSESDYPGSNSLGSIYRGRSYGDIQVLTNVENLYESGDIRAEVIGYESFDSNQTKLRNLKKYPSSQGTDNVGLLRFEEILFNYSEALLNKGRNSDALVALNEVIRERGVADYTEIDAASLALERRREFIFEGFRFDDLARSGQNIEKIDPNQNFPATVVSGDYRFSLPIPQSEIDANSNVVQNNGY